MEDLFNHTVVDISKRSSTKKNEAAEAIVQYGARSVSEWQLLTALGIPEESARALMAKAENTLAAIHRMSIIEIASIRGIGAAKATAITAALEIGRRRQHEQRANKQQISSSLDCYDILHSQVRDLTQEVFIIMLIDRRSKVLRVEEIHRGGMHAMVVDPKIIFQKALEYKACSIILCHNHPSGAPSPSMEDIRLTEKVKLAGQYLDLKVLDHIIIGDGSYYSFADEGKI